MLLFNVLSSSPSLSIAIKALGRTNLIKPMPVKTQKIDDEMKFFLMIYDCLMLLIESVGGSNMARKAFPESQNFINLLKLTVTQSNQTSVNFTASVEKKDPSLPREQKKIKNAKEISK